MMLIWGRGLRPSVGGIWLWSGGAGASAEEEAGGLVCATPGVRPRIEATAGVRARVDATARVRPRVLATAGIEEC